MKNDSNICERLKVILYSKNMISNRKISYRSIIIVRLKDIDTVWYDPNEIIDYYKVNHLLKDTKQSDLEQDVSKFKLMKTLNSKTKINFVSNSKSGSLVRFI